MELSDRDLAFLADHQAAAMVTVAPDGIPKTARVGVALVDGRLWSSGTQDRVRTARLRQDPRCTVFVFSDSYRWLTLETTVTILEGPDVPDLSVRLFRAMQGRPTGPLSWFGGELDEAAFRQQMVTEGRLVYEFTVHRSYGTG
ncbi:pyridoxamine 5'-phosphate oxidase family protein [Streptacidiphilus anmyonensis]|uniref:pyridoxamine 5'-phosphate oxidase family protein n=1 Tax=Streptacidiphilus anmyonensis TaxID=405782 RepID=UPI000693ADA9|nr:pyridoxamine 5'-phosphate oxidase family protein [Streptacidiphilus anmyonensis]